MDFDIIKSSTYDHHQMDMMAMMMQMEKFPADFCSPHQNLPTMHEPEFPAPAIGISPLPMFHNADVAPISMTNHPHSTISFMAAHQVQEPVPQQQMQQEMVTAGGFSGPSDGAFASQYEKRNSVAAMREMIFRMAVMQPIHIDPESVKPPKRRNVRISTDPQSVAARHRRERISEKIRTLQRLVPGGAKMDTASMLDEAIHYVKFLKKQVQTLEQVSANRPLRGIVEFPASTANANLNQSSFLKGSQSAQIVGSMQMFH